MSLNQLIEEHAAAVFIRADHFASPLLRYIGGDAGHVVQFSGIVDIAEPELDDMRGRGRVYRGTIAVAQSVTITAIDAVRFETKRFEVESVDIPIHGMKTVHIVRYEGEHAGREPLKGAT